MNKQETIDTGNLPKLGETEIKKSTPPKDLTRNQYGLFDNIEYSYDDNGLINWRSLIPKEHVYINQQYKEELEKRFNKTLTEIDFIQEKLDDKYLVIRLSGLKYLLFLRGYNTVDFEIRTSTETYASVTCRIGFIPNYETNNRSVNFSDNACATFNNTKGFTQYYLVEMASNRAFARAIRNFLRINIVSQEELGSQQEEKKTDIQSQTNIYQILENKASQKGRTFDNIKEYLIKSKFPNAESFNKFSDIPENKVFDIIEKLQSVKDKKD